MKAAVLYEFGQPLVVEDIEVDAPKDGEIKVKLAACAICHSDIHAIEGAWGGSLPVVYGHEAAGVIDEVGAGVTRVAAGDHVVVTLIRSCGRCHHCAKGDVHICEGSFALNTQSRLRTRDGDSVSQGIKTGAFAEYVVVDQSQAIPVPEEVPLDSASLLACGVITGLGAVVNTAGVETGSSVVVIGSGGVGLNSIQGASLCGAHPIIAADLLDTKLEAAREFGATHTINAGEADPVEAILEITGEGADFTLECVGDPRVLRQAVDALTRGGVCGLAGAAPPGDEVSLDMQILLNARTVRGIIEGDAVSDLFIPRLIELYRQGRLPFDRLIQFYPFEEINQAVEDMEKGLVIKPVLRP